LHLPEAVAAQLLAAEPPCDHDDVILQLFPLEHAKDVNAGVELGHWAAQKPTTLSGEEGRLQEG